MKIVGWSRLQRIDHHVQRVAAQVDHRRRVDPDVRPVVVASQRMRHRRSEIRAQQHCPVVNVDGVHRVVFRRHINHIVRALVRSRRDLHTRHDQRLRVHLVIERHGPHQTERVPHVGGRQHCFALIPAGTVVVVVIGGDSYLARSQQCTRADENKDGKYSRAANAAISFTMSWHVPVLFWFSRWLLPEAFDPFAAGPIPAHGNQRANAESSAAPLGERSVELPEFNASRGSCKQRFSLFPTA